jgi:2-polyprenyl-6-methoxyphenol hydroxylase-like FAD-dependent oxidoreductase
MEVSILTFVLNFDGRLKTTCRTPDEHGGRADGIQPRTVEIWDTLGVGDALRKTGLLVYSFVKSHMPDAYS